MTAENTRWHSGLRRYMASAKADAFVADLLQVFKKHGLVLTDADGYESYSIEQYGEDTERFINLASLGSTVEWEAT